MKKMMYTLGVFLLSAGAIAKTNSNLAATEVEVTNSDLFKSIKPEDGQPVVFANQAELDGKVEDKIQNMKQQLVENRNNPEMVIYLKQELWRFENAIVKIK